MAEALGIVVIEKDLQGRAGGLTWGEPALIELHEADSPERRRFTLAHELAHFAIGSDSLQLSRRFTVGPMTELEEERLCDRVAAELLMPQAETDSPNDLTIGYIRVFAAENRVSLVAAAARLIEVGRHNAVFVKAEKIGRFWEVTGTVGIDRSRETLEIPPSLSWILDTTSDLRSHEDVEILVNGIQKVVLADIQRSNRWSALLLYGLRWRHHREISSEIRDS